MASSSPLPDWPAGTVTFLVTAGPGPHAIPVSASLRAGPDRILLGLGRNRASLERLRADPRVTVAVCATDLAFSADGTATVVEEALTDRVVAVAVQVNEVHDHSRPTFALEAGVRWHWTDSGAARADAEVNAALRALAQSDPPA